MDVSKKGKGQITMPGDLKVTSSISAKSISLQESATIEGDLIVKGNIIGLPQPEEKKAEGPKIVDAVHLGDPDVDGAWRIRMDDENGMLFIEKREDGEWVAKQGLL